MPDNQNDLLAEVLEKMIDCQMSNTQALTGLKSAVDDSNKNSKAILGHFSNGFRSEIKSHITDESAKQNDQQTKILECLKEVKKEIQTFKSVGFWIKVILGFITALGVISAAIIKIVDVVNP